ncbi:MAG: NFACT family protein [Eubacteriales bacterium]|nr:NFACT family protein [Eubacteriales bacterium]
MPFDGLMLYHAARELHQTLSGGRVDKIVQPERDEVIITVRAGGANHQLLLSASAGCARAHLTRIKKNNPLEPPMLCMLLRKHLLGARILSVLQAESDRILEIELEHTDELGDRARKRIVCEFMGRHSNIIFTAGDGRILDSARRVNEQISSVREVLPGLRYERPPAHGKIPFDRAEESALLAAFRGKSGALHKLLSQCVSGLSTQTAREIAYRIAGNEDVRLEDIGEEASAAGAWTALQDMLGRTNASILYAETGQPIDVTPVPYRSRTTLRTESFATLSEALDEFYRARDMEERISQKSASIHRVLKTNIERCQRKAALQQEALLGSQHMEEYRLNGELLTASMHLAKKGNKSVALPNYYADGMPMVEVALDEKLSPGQNAQRYFKLYQKARSAQILAKEQLEKTTEELRYLEGQMDNLSKCTEEAELSEIRQELEKFGYVKANRNRRQMKALPPSKPMKFVSPSGIPILVGKNNLQNDKLTFSAEPDEVWMHAKDMPGSHVIVASAAPDDVTLQMAARLAARYSSGGTSTRVPVDMTRRKFVKKPSGAKPGFVIYTHQRTVFVLPWEEEAKS